MAANFEPVTVPFPAEYPSNGYAQRWGNGGNRVFSGAVNGADWLAAGSHIPYPGGVSGGGDAAFGQDYWYQNFTHAMCLLLGGNWSHGGNAGPGAVRWGHSRAGSNTHVGVALASYL